MTKRKNIKVRKGAWFIKVRGSYLPYSWQGWLSYIPFVGFLVWSIIWAFNTSQPVSQTALLLFPSWIAAAVVMTWLAARTS
ncbi:MAG TPA: hypothetical protein VLF90_02085 [Patescibacteria group bacterium]|nr:hypothetical protein [Patescibacteria group bacterium]